MDALPSESTEFNLQISRSNEARQRRVIENLYASLFIYEEARMSKRMND